MSDELDEELEKLKRAIAELEVASKKALGFMRTIDYNGVTFNIGSRFVIADLAPLVFFHLVERIDGDAVENAVVQLSNRLTPLLTCVHQWTVLKRRTDQHLREMAGESIRGNVSLCVCRACTAYALNGPGIPLPLVGRQRKQHTP